ncbi:MAG: hypothetical protein HFJ19_04370 [Clostridia bacterium]|nr:hypothetical protein [Clostridia bacterium]
MIDLHAHILTDTDDGASSFEESVALLYEARKAGFTGIVCTPHYMQGFYEKDANYINNKMKELEMDAKRIGIHLYQGNEIYGINEICKILKEKKIVSLNNSKYLLIEFSLNNEPIKNSVEIIDEIVKNGYIPIIAHPERYPYVQKDIKFLKSLLKKGVLLQANYASIDGYYGIPAKKTIIKLLKNKMIQFLGSDVHDKRTIYVNIPQYIKKISKYLSENEIDELVYKNPIKVIHNEIITIDKSQL